ncbi:hypothetical protein [Shimia sp. Alg240-R146]|uniref:hypothetical protein n=1 Tax=Shimia sp. Alg240-R146 TaxID=2993449 RepID=UPI0022E931B6|nr:hypothetical protein [Shimia sp. Alg240-R146]
MSIVAVLAFSPMARAEVSATLGDVVIKLDARVDKGGDPYKNVGYSETRAFPKAVKVKRGQVVRVVAALGVGKKEATGRRFKCLPFLRAPDGRQGPIGKKGKCSKNSNAEINGFTDTGRADFTIVFDDVDPSGTFGLQLEVTDTKTGKKVTLLQPVTVVD